MHASRTPLIAGNWKMNLDHLQAIANVQKLAWSLKDAEHDYTSTEVAVFPPFTDLRSVQTLIGADKLPLGLGAQDLSPHASGAYTGDISGQFLAKLSVNYVIVGHSERRALHHEDDATVAAKAKAAIANGLIPVICIGETQEEKEHTPEDSVPRDQLATILAELPKNATYVVAYEPVWAIGSGEAATPAEANRTIGVIRNLISERRGEDEAATTRILYGGSVSSQNVAQFLHQPEIDGVLVGGASLDADEFSRIAQFRKHVVAG